jgi:phage gp29-like protein
MINSLKSQGKSLPPIKPGWELVGVMPKKSMGAVRPTNMPVVPSPEAGGYASGSTPWIVPAAQVRWLGPGVAFYTPQRCEQLFRQALAGDLQSQWEMFDLMECTWPELSKCLAELKDDVIANEFHIEPFKLRDQEPSEEAERRAAFVDDCLCSMYGRPECDENDYTDTIRDLLDARGKGISVLELAWESRTLPGGETAMAPRCSRWVHPAWYGYEFGPGDTNLKLKPGPYTVQQSTVLVESRQFMDFPPHRFLIGICKNRTGHPLGAAMLWQLGFWWAMSNFTAEWAMNFAQMFGQPIRWATYAPTMMAQDQATLANILQNMGSSAWAMFPEGTRFELKEAMSKGSDNIQLALLEFADKQCQKLILRQVLSSDVNPKGGSRAAGEVHERTLDGVKLALAKWACKTLQPLVKSICLLNFGDLTECPYLVPAKDEDEDPGELAGTLNTLGQAGLELTDEAVPEISERLGIAVQKKAVPEPMDPTLPPKPGAPKNPATEAVAKNVSAAKHPADVIAERKRAAMAQIFRGRYTPLRRIVLESHSAEECLAKLDKEFPQLAQAPSLPGLIEEAMQVAAAAAAKD